MFGIYTKNNMAYSSKNRTLKYRNKKSAIRRTLVGRTLGRKLGRRLLGRKFGGWRAKQSKSIKSHSKSVRSTKSP